MTNKLGNEKSPYLLQHAENPVEWLPWSEEALDRARREDKPLLVSIGYAACHWCHVMAHESFEDDDTATLMNDLYVSVKVDREERPDIDAIYMEAVQALTGQGGWPLNVFLTPEGQPFWGGTYFPPTPRSGMPSWSQILRGVAEAYRERREDVTHTAASLTQAIREAQTVRSTNQSLSPELLRLALDRMTIQFDLASGGFQGAPKFPQPLALEFILRMQTRFSRPSALQFVELTLKKMAAGGIRDQLGGGFHRYSVDAGWIVPHFEKMLYDNALIALVYTHAFQITGNDEYADIAGSTLDFILREMRSTGGGFYSSQDADSEGQEGKFYVWDLDDIREVLGDEEAALVALRYGVTHGGNFEGKTILTAALSVEEVSGCAAKPVQYVEEVLERSVRKLLDARAQRIAPPIDTKILMSWNALVIRALAEAGRVLRRNEYLSAATETAHFVHDRMCVQGVWRRSYNDGPGQTPAFLEDHAYLLEALISIFEATWDSEHLERAQELALTMVQRFWDDALPGFYDTPNDGEVLLVRPRGLFDNPIPSGNAAASLGLLRLAALTGARDYEALALPAIQAMRDMYGRSPLAFGHLLSGLDFHLSSTLQIGIVGIGDPDGTDAMACEVYDRYLPNKVLAVAVVPHALLVTPLFSGRSTIGGRATAYVCEHFACKLPVTEPGALRSQLDGTVAL